MILSILAPWLTTTANTVKFSCWWFFVIINNTHFKEPRACCKQYLSCHDGKLWQTEFDNSRINNTNSKLDQQVWLNRSSESESASRLPCYLSVCSSERVLLIHFTKKCQKKWFCKPTSSVWSLTQIPPVGMGRLHHGGGRTATQIPPVEMDRIHYGDGQRRRSHQLGCVGRNH